MGIPGGANLLLAAGGVSTYEIDYSLRFDEASYLSRTLSSSGDRQKFTFSAWVKDSLSPASPDHSAIFTAFAGTSGEVMTRDYGRQLYFSLNAGGGSEAGNIKPVNKLRDNSAWYHLVFRLDSTQSDANNRLRAYINGVQSDTTRTVTFAQNGSTNYFNRAYEHRLGMFYSSIWGWNGYLAETHFVDGQSLDPTEFGEYDDNGVWRPIAYSGSYGTNGFYMKYDPDATNGVGHDHSGNGNNFTATGFTTSGTGTDVMSDTPTNNYATLNPLAVRPSYIPTFSEGNLKVTHRSGTGQYSHCGSTFAFRSDDSAGFYCEVQNFAQSYGGVSLIDVEYGVHRLDPDVSNGFSTNTNGGIGYDSNGYLRNYGSTTDYTSSYSYNGGSDILGIAVKDNKVWFSINGSWIASGNPSTGANPTITLSSTKTFVVGSYGQGSRVFINNFGQRDFTYTVPTGFKAMSTSNLPAPDIADGSQYFNTVLYTGNGSDSHAITGVGFQPDLVWGKARAVTTDHYWVDSVRGATKVLRSNVYNPEYTQSDSLVSFDSDGFTLDNDNSGGPAGNFNINTRSYVAWNWLKGANQGFNIVTWTGAGQSTQSQISHGLGVKPAMVIMMARTQPANYNHYVWHQSLSGASSGTNTWLRFDLPNARETGTTNGPWGTNGTNFNSTTFSVGNEGNNSGSTYVAYCFAEVEGFSKFGEYTGNGNSEGPFVYCGFRPAWIMYKRTGGSDNWFVYDTTRDDQNVSYKAVRADQTTVEKTSSTDIPIDMLSNGFKIRFSGTAGNGSGESIVFAAFAEHPFGGDGVSPATAR